MKSRIVNVASIPQRSPFRYPGGKTWLVPYIRAWMRSLEARPTAFVEPFLGGGIVSLTVGFENLACKVVMAEKDEDIAAVWQAILEDDGQWLATRIMEFEVSVDSVKEQLSKPIESQRERAFNTILRNRTFHGGIMAQGSSLVKFGENGKGITSRWYPRTLHTRIMDIVDAKERFTFILGDGIELLKKSNRQKTSVFFIDPPYTAGGNGKRAGRRLYNHHELDHGKLFDVTSSLKGDFLMTYDNDPEVLELAKDRDFDTALVPMKNTHHAKMFELLIGRDLDWVRAMFDTKERFLF